MEDVSARINGASRKQNVACDACRQKKVRCQRETINEKCAQCAAKGSECTSHYVESLQNKVQKRAKNIEIGDAPGPSKSRKISEVNVGPARIVQGKKATGVRKIDRPASERQADMIRFLFRPDAVTDDDGEYTDLPDMDLCRSGRSDIWESMGGSIYKEEPSEIHLRLDDRKMNELVDDLLDTFFSIVHIRFPILDPNLTRARFANPDTHPDGPLSHGLLATMLASGVRFSENPIIIRDREEISQRDQGERTRSRIMQLMVVRAREVCEVRKIHRIVSSENCAALIFLEPLLGQSAFLKEKYQAFHVGAATRHACTLGLMNQDSLMAIQDEKARISAVFMWWLVGLSDGWRACFNRLAPFLTDDDFDTDPPPFMRDAAAASRPQFGSTGAASSSMDASLDAIDNATVFWFTASNAGCYICRQLCRGLWIPRVRRSGIATSTIRDFVHANSLWRDKYISKLGVPSRWPEQWDFLAAISSCTTDAYFHCLWMIVNEAIEEFGLEDMKKVGPELDNTNRLELNSLRRRIKEESDHGALRIASLVSVLTENGYLRLDPLILYYPMYLAGKVLANSGKEESKSCVAGLRQFSLAYPQLWELADELEAVYASKTGRPRNEPSPNLEFATVEQILANVVPAGHLGPMGPWPDNGSPGAPSNQQTQRTAADNWNVMGAGAVLTANGFTALPMQNKPGTPGVGPKDASLALFDWLHHQ